MWVNWAIWFPCICSFRCLACPEQLLHWTLGTVAAEICMVRLAWPLSSLCRLFSLCDCDLSHPDKSDQQTPGCSMATKNERKKLTSQVLWALLYVRQVTAEPDLGNHLLKKRPAVTRPPPQPQGGQVLRVLLSFATRAVEKKWHLGCLAGSPNPKGGTFFCFQPSRIPRARDILGCWCDPPPCRRLQ